MKYYFFLWVLAAIVCSCRTARFVHKSAKELLIDDKALAAAHVGISVYSPDEKKYLYNYQGEKYFVPASNVKIATCYAAMKYLGDSLTGGHYAVHKYPYFKGTQTEREDIVFKPSGDPTFLHKDFKQQPVFDLLKNNGMRIVFKTESWQTERWGKGWAWDDYQESYMPERSALPMYGNIVSFNAKKHPDSLQWLSFHPINDFTITPSFFQNSSYYKTASLDTFIHHHLLDSQLIKHLEQKGLGYKMGREINSNRFFGLPELSPPSNQEVPFHIDFSVARSLLKDTLQKEVLPYIDNHGHNRYTVKDSLFKKIKSQPTDSLLKPMMHRSDNFFAEQSLLMVSNEVLGVMNDERIIDTLLKTDFKELPQRPRWVDGSGLSRYNLFTPQDLVFILDKMQQEFGMERIKEILPAGNEGTLKNYFNSDSSFIYAKTGTLSGIVALSGYLYTRKNKLLVFSVLVNNHQASSIEVRRAVERFIHLLREKK
jgi:serine-type D-Ala-D-Ala carboxypeptidase/endopeptidase (penicillin-binding protein 4)